MSMRMILAPILGTDADKKILEAAGMLAKARNGHVQALYVHRDPREVMLGQVGEGMTSSMLDSLMTAAEKQNDQARGAARATYEAWRKSAEVTESDTPGDGTEMTASWSEETGDPSKVIARKGRLCDVTCVVQPEEDDPSDMKSMLESAMLQTGKAVLLVPGHLPFMPISKAAVAWNGSREAARAVAMTMPILEAADSVVVLAGTSDMLTPEEVEEFVQSLRWQGINATANTFGVGGGTVSGRLQAMAREQEAQVLVLGAYSHSRLRELVFGGVTDDILAGARMPILMAH